MPVADLAYALTLASPESGLRPDYGLYADYHAGRHQLKFASRDFERRYGEIVLSLRENLCPAVVSAFTDDLSFDDWGSQDQRAIDAGLSRLATLVHDETWRSGDAYAIVWPNRKGELIPTYVAARDAIPIVADDDTSQLAYLTKRWIDRKTGHGRAFVLYPDHAERFVTADALTDPVGQSTHGKASAYPTNQSSWVPYVDDDGLDYIAHKFGTVPACWWRLDAVDVDSYGSSILANVIPIQDALNKSVADMVVTSEAYSRPFWYLLRYQANGGTAAPVNPYLGADPAAATATQQSSAAFDPTQQHIFATSSEGPFGQLDPPDLTRLLKVQDGYALKIARIVGVPAYYFTQTGIDVPSGASLRVLNARRRARIGKFQDASTPVWRGLGQLLGMADPEPTWAPIDDIDPVEAWEIAATQNDLGLDLVDILDYVGMPDATNVALRAGASSSAMAAAAGAAMRQGAITY